MKSPEEYWKSIKVLHMESAIEMIKQVQKDALEEGFNSAREIIPALSGPSGYKYNNVKDLLDEFNK